MLHVLLHVKKACVEEKIIREEKDLMKMDKNDVLYVQRVVHLTPQPHLTAIPLQ
jgi:hypothetical protein